MKKATLAFCIGLLLLAIISQSFSLAVADPYVYVGDVPPKPDTIPPLVSIFSPKNDTAYSVNNIALTFKINPPKGPTVDHPIIMEIYYKEDGQQDKTSVYKYTSAPYSGYPTNGEYTEYSYTLAPLSLPWGNHSITVFAEYHGWYIPGNDPSTLSMNSFSITGSSTVSFAISYKTSSSNPSPSPSPTPTSSPAPTTTPSPSPEPTTTPSQQPTPIPEPFPTILALSSVSMVAVVVLDLLFYFKKRHKLKSA
jgi:hypothetical protein